MAFIEIQNFSYSYPGKTKPALRNINLAIDQGAFIVISGKSGSGKSTLGKALAGYLFQDEKPVYSGQILVDQVNMANLPLYEASEKVAYVQQNPEDQFCTLTVMDEIAFGLENLCISPEEINKRIDDVFTIVSGVDLRDRDLASLSGGEKQKIAIASLLVLSPDVLILDEPTSNLDPQATESIFETLSTLCQEKNLTIFVIEHKLSGLKAFEHEHFIMEAGKLFASKDHKGSQPNPPDIIYSFPNSPKPTFNSQGHLIELNNVSVSRGGRRVLSNINLTISSGELIALMGPNGSGKTTLLETIIGFHSCQKGSVTAFGSGNEKIRISSLIPYVGYIFQNPDHQLFTQSVWEEAVYTSENLLCMDDKRKINAEELLSQLDLLVHKDTHPQKLSYGEKRRLNLISAVLHGPKLLLIDELLIGQDMVNAETWMRYLYKFSRLGNSVVLVNHHAELSKKYCDRVLFMEKGHITIDQPLQEAFQTLETLGYYAFLPFPAKEPANG